VRLWKRKGNKIVKQRWRERMEGWRERGGRKKKYTPLLASSSIKGVGICPPW
jgi:hypothetical protein